MSLKLAVSRSRPPFTYGANFQNMFGIIINVYKHCTFGFCIPIGVRGEGAERGTCPFPPKMSLSGKTALIGNERRFISVNEWSRSLLLRQESSILSEHGLVIAVLFGSSLDQNPVLPAVSLELPTPFK